jgi:hypothetical protein
MKREPRGKFDPTKIVARGTVELPPELHAKAVSQTEIADGEFPISLRWDCEQCEDR